MKKRGKRLADTDRPRKTGAAAKSLAGSALTQTLARKKDAGASPAKAKGSKTGHVVKSVAGSALTQHVSARRTANGKMVRIVLAPISSGSLKRERVDLAVSKVLASRKK